MVLVATLLALLAQVPPAQPDSEQIETCVACHGDRDLNVKLASGEVQALFVDRERFTRSVHGTRLSCADCHANMTELPHAPISYRTRREFTMSTYEQCKRCHFANYTKTLDSVHYRALARGDAMAPVCIDCHGSHDTRPPGQRSRVSQTCAKCHEGVYRTYEQSVHGRALVAEGNPDVPSCIDCHRSHDVSGPRTADWRGAVPDLCGKCHAKEKLMSKYGLSSNVLGTYVSDFHGMTASLRTQERGGTERRFVALCTDCHGVHDITKTKAPGSRVIRANLTETCRRCHPGASDDFPDAWLSHYEPSWQRAPLVYGVKLFYAGLIPFMIGGLVLQMLLHLWRVVVNR
ncbi:MAG: cytochrome c3 family protein [Acidobacteria bacterium]|nr:cytochrome c3 family protein [Acidobacteriota bacterium]